MPRRYFNYPPRMQTLHVISTTGAMILAVGLLWTLAYLIVAWRRGPIAGDNPWRSAGFEWRTTSPPPEHNFITPLAVEPDAYDYPEHGEAGGP
jgi:cytochrome c oxidase subunit 1